MNIRNEDTSSIALVFHAATYTVSELEKVQAEILEKLARNAKLSSFDLEEIVLAQASAEVATEILKIIAYYDDEAKVARDLKEAATNAVFSFAGSHSTSEAHNMLANAKHLAWIKFAKLAHM